MSLKMNITPVNGCILVELTEPLDIVDLVDKQYGTKTSGIVIAAPDHPELVDCKVYFKDFSDGVQITVDDKILSLIEYKEVRGYLE